jgi:ABC-type multidrug transport system ATPase subunit
MARLKKLILDKISVREPINNTPLLVLDHLELNTGFIYGVAGRNFSGRSTLLRMIGGGFLLGSECLEPGEQKLEFEYPNQILALNSSVYSVYIGSNPHDSLSTLTSTVKEELILHHGMSQRNNTENTHLEEEFYNLISSFRLKELFTKNPMDLSGGETASLSVVCAILMRRPILCVDETLAHLDIELRQKAWLFLKQFAREGNIVLVADNNYDLMAEYTDLVIMLEGKHVNGVGTPKEIFNRSDVVRQKTVPTVTRIAAQLQFERDSLPTRYRELYDILSKKL